MRGLLVHWHWVVVGSVIAGRTAILGLSAWPVHQGYVEVFYVNVASGATPLPEGLNVLPMRYLPIEWSFAVFGESEWAARFPGMIALGISAFAASGLGLILAGEFGRKWAPVFLVTNPWVLAWYGRAMPDAWLATSVLLTGLVVLKANERPFVYGWLVGPSLLLGLASKPTAFLSLGLLIMSRRRDAFLVSLTSIAATLALAGNLATHGHPWLLVGRLSDLIASRPSVEARFADVPGMFTGGLLLGCAGIAWMAWARPLADPSLPLYGFLWYAIWDAIPNHAYYALPIATWASVAATPFLQSRRRLTVVMVTVSLLVIPVALFDTGSLGDRRTRIVESFPENATVAIPNHLAQGPMFEYYRPDLHLVGPGQPANYTVSSSSVLDGCTRIGSRSYLGSGFYAFDCTGDQNG